MESLKQNGTFELVDLPVGKNLVGCKWAFKLKTNGEGKPVRYKARLVAQGFSQKFGTDYEEVFAPVAHHITFRTLLTIAAARAMDIHHFDAKTAFLNGELQEEIYMRQPQGFSRGGSEQKVCFLKKSLYGLRQLARVWNQTLHEVLVSMKLTQSDTDACLYQMRRAKPSTSWYMWTIFWSQVTCLNSSEDCWTKSENTSPSTTSGRLTTIL